MKNVNLLILLLFACFFSNGLHAEMVKGDLHKYPHTVHIHSEGTYFAVVSKPGYKTVETECFATREIVGIARTAMLVPEEEGKKGNGGGIIVIAIVIVLAIGVWWMERKKCKRRIKLIQ